MGVATENSNASASSSAQNVMSGVNCAENGLRPIPSVSISPSSSSSSSTSSSEAQPLQRRRGGGGRGQRADNNMGDGDVRLPLRYKLSNKRKSNKTSAPRTRDNGDDLYKNTHTEDVKTHTADTETHTVTTNERICIQINGEPCDNERVGDESVFQSDNEEEEDEGVISDSPQQREKDLTVALQWLRQEFQSLRDQDKQLARQFISLRSAIRHLQLTAPSLGSGGSCGGVMNTSFSSAEDLAFYSSSASSLEHQNTASSCLDLGPRPASSGLRADDYSGDFRPRTQSMLETRKTSSERPSHSPMLSVRRCTGRTGSKECF